MSDTSSTQAFLTIDMKQNRLRIYKSVLHQLGDPKYIQLLVNPEEMVVALRCVDVTSKGDQTHKLKMTTNNCVEISSMVFIRKLVEIAGGLDPAYSYRLSGSVVPDKRLAVFSLKSITRIEKQER